MGAIGGGINLSKAKTPQDSDIRYMPIDDRASSLSPLNQSGKQLRKKNRILNLSSEHKNLKDAYDSGQKVNENRLFNIEDKLAKKEEKYETRYGKNPYAKLLPKIKQ